MNDKLEFVNDFDHNAVEIWKHGVYDGYLLRRCGPWEVARIGKGSNSYDLRRIADKLDELNGVKK